MLLRNEVFIEQLHALLLSVHVKGTVFITQKRGAFLPPCAAQPCTPLTPPPTLPNLPVVPRVDGIAGAPCCMYRATDGKKRKLATLVGADEKAQFHAEVMGVLKTGMVGLRKAEKKKKGEREAGGGGGGGGSGGGGGAATAPAGGKK